MRNIVLRILSIGLSVFLSSTAALAESAPLLLNYQEWSSLSNDEQINYLKEIQKIMAGMDQRSEFFAQAQSEMSSSRSPASVDNSEAYAKVAEKNLNTADDLIQKAEKMKNPEKKYAQLKKVADMLEVDRYGISLIQKDNLYTPAYKKWMSVHDELKKNSNVQSQLKPGNPVSISSEIDRIDKTNADLNNLMQSSILLKSSENQFFNRKPQPGTNAYNEGIAEIKKQNAIYNVDAAEVKKNKAAILSAKKQYDKAASLIPKGTSLVPKKSDGEFFRCMYAGFILKENCKAPSSLPKNSELLGIKKDNFNCDKSLVLCNPLVFGGVASCPIDAKTNKDSAAKCLSEMKGFCKPKSTSATHECLEEAEKSPNNLENTALLIHANPAAWNDYTNAFHGLCDEGKISQNRFTQKKGEEPRTDTDHVKKDIEKTCDWARERLLKLRDEAKIGLNKIDGSQQGTPLKKSPEPAKKAVPGNK